MYRIYWLNSSDEWILFSSVGNEDTAYEEYNNCCDMYPHHKVKITKEVIMRKG